MMVIEQVKKAQAQLTEQINENPTTKEFVERLEVISDKVSDQIEKVTEQVAERVEAAQDDAAERVEAAQDEMSERFDELTKFLVSANTKVADAVTARLVRLPGADRLPQPKQLVESYFDAIERFTASNRDLAIKLVSPWLIEAPAGTAKAKTKATVVDSPAKAAAAAKKLTARKASARKTTAKKATARKTTAKKVTARKTTARKSTASAAR